MSTGKVLSVIALVIAGLVALFEVNYYVTHRYRPGVSPHLIGLSAAVVLLAIGNLVRRSKVDR